ncbi:hypothetical protein F5887DRAFT_971991, partial [Amanita rubescens]
RSADVNAFRSQDPNYVSIDPALRLISSSQRFRLKRILVMSDKGPQSHIDESKESMRKKWREENAHWVKGYALSRQAIFKEAGLDPLDYPENETALMHVVCEWCDLTSDNFSLVKYQEGGKDSKYRWVLIIDQAYGKDGETVLKSRDPPSRLPFDIEEVEEFLEPDLKIWRSPIPKVGMVNSTGRPEP